MSRGIKLPGSSKAAASHRECSKCNEVVPPEGGIQLSPARWYCSKCWINFRLKK